MCVGVLLAGTSWPGPGEQTSKPDETSLVEVKKFRRLYTLCFVGFPPRNCFGSLLEFAPRMVDDVNKVVFCLFPKCPDLGRGVFARRRKEEGE